MTATTIRAAPSGHHPPRSLGGTAGALVAAVPAALGFAVNGDPFLAAGVPAARLPVPAIAIRLALRGQSTLALGSRRVVPARAMELGYRFVHDDVTEAKAAALADSRR
jgi:NAD dependent epimerase/dehydratase family enzyme